MIEKPFDAAVQGEAQERAHSKHPQPDEMHRAGITTRDTLNWMERQELKTPAPRLTPTDQMLQQTADEQTETERQRQIKAMRARFDRKAEKVRGDLTQAHDYRGPER